MMDVRANHLLRSSDQLRSDDGFSPTLMGWFLIAFPLAGFVVLVFAFWSQSRGRHDYKENFRRSFSMQQRNLSSIQNVYNALNAMFIMDIANGVTSIILGSALISYCENGSMCNISSTVFFLTRCFGIIYHLMVALHAIFHLCNPSQEFRHRYAFSAVFVLVAVASPVYVYYSGAAFILLAVITLGLALIIMSKSKTPTASPSHAIKKNLISSVALFTFWTVYFPSFVIECLILSGSIGYAYLHLEVLYYTSFNIIMDGVLCCLILSLSSEEQEVQQIQPTPQWQHPPPQWQQPPPQWQQPPPQWQQPPPQWQQPPPQYGTENPGYLPS